MSEIKKWRQNAGLTQQQMSGLFDIPKRTIENWDMGNRLPAPWAEKLLIEKLMQITDENVRRKMQKLANTLKSDENGNRPVGSWALITTNGWDQFIHCCKDMQDAIRSANPGDEVAYVLCNQTESGPEPWYKDRNDETCSEYDWIDWEPEPEEEEE